MQATDIGHGRGWLDAPAAASLRRVDGEIGRPLDVNSAGRTRKEQEEARAKYFAGGPYAAPPGTSPHEFGNAVDTDDRFVGLMARHGWSRPLASEPWHFVYYPARDMHRTETAAALAVTTPQKEETVDLIPIVYDADNKKNQYAIGNKGRLHLTGYQADLLARYNAAAKGQRQELTIAEMDKLITEVLSKVAG